MSAEAELEDRGFCVLRGHFARPLVEACRAAFWPVLLEYVTRHEDQPNRGPHRHFLPMPFTAPCFAPEFFFDAEVLRIVRKTMGDRVVADQWGCDVALEGSTYQGSHVDYQRPLFPERADWVLPPYILVVSFGLAAITLADGPIEIAPGTQRMARSDAMRAMELLEIEMQPVVLGVGDVLIRHPWALHRGTPNTTATPRALVSIRYVRHWYTDQSREGNAIPGEVWHSLTKEQQGMMRFSRV